MKEMMKEFMKKKEYFAPSIQVIEMENSCSILAASGEKPKDDYENLAEFFVPTNLQSLSIFKSPVVNVTVLPQVFKAPEPPMPSVFLMTYSSGFVLLLKRT